MSRGFQRPAARPCAGGGAATPGCDPAVCGAQKRRHTGKLRERNQGPGPPDTRREEDDRVGAAIALPFRGENAHFAEQFLLGHAEQSRDPPVLKRSEGKATGHEDAGHAAGESDAEGAVGVEEEPASAGTPSLTIGQFRAKRNHGPQKNGLAPVPPSRLAENLSQLSAYLAAYLATHFHESLQRARGHAQNLFVEAAHGTQELEHVFQALARIGVALAVAAELGNTFLKNAKRRINFAALTLFGDGAEDLPDVLEGFEVIAAVTQNVDDADNAPSLELAQAVADVGAGHGERLGDFLGMERPRGKEQQGMDLSDGAVDAPAGAHFAPVEDELLRDGSKGGHFVFSSFCQDRIYRHLCCLSRSIYEKPRPRGTCTFQGTCGHSFDVLRKGASRSWQALCRD